MTKGRRLAPGVRRCLATAAVVSLLLTAWALPARADVMDEDAFCAVVQDLIG
jgi:hypothetical protein